MHLPQRASDGVWTIVSAAEVLHLKPLMSNAKSRRQVLTVERFRTGHQVTTPPVRFENQHLVGIQWTGTLEEIDGALRPSLPNGTSIFPVGLSLEGRTMSGVEFTNLSLSPSFIRRVALETDLYERFELVPQWAIRDKEIESIAHAAECEIQDGLRAGSLFMESLATALAAHLLARYSARPAIIREYRGGMVPYQLRRSIDFVQANLGGDFGLTELAENVGMSPFYFCRLFKQSTGLSPHQFVIRERIEHARQLLKEHRLSIAEIAATLGFSDQSHFSRAFRKLAGTTPKRYSHQH